MQMEIKVCKCSNPLFTPLPKEFGELVGKKLLQQDEYIQKCIFNLLLCHGSVDIEKSKHRNYDDLKEENIKSHKEKLKQIKLETLSSLLAALNQSINITKSCPGNNLETIPGKTVKHSMIPLYTEWEHLNRSDRCIIMLDAFAVTFLQGTKMNTSKLTDNHIRTFIDSRLLYYSPELRQIKKEKSK